MRIYVLPNPRAVALLLTAVVALPMRGICMAFDLVVN